jgi:hypothetical protein
MGQAGDKEGLERALAVVGAIKNVEYKASALSAVAQAMGQAGDMEGLERTLAVVGSIKYGRHKTSALGAVAQAMGHVGDKEGLELALAVAEAIQDDGPKASALSAVVHAMAQAGEYLKGLQVLRNAVWSSRLFSREEMFRVLEVAAESLAAIDKGTTLWQIYETIQEVDGWWSAKSIETEK